MQFRNFTDFQPPATAKPLRDGSGHIGVKYVNKCELLKNAIRFGPSFTVYEL
jgi:hypothetical protein